MASRYAGPPRSSIWQRLEQQEKIRGDGDIVHIGGEIQGFTENTLTPTEKRKLNDEYGKQSLYYETLKVGDIIQLWNIPLPELKI
jgi:hypothetical protein